MCYLMNDHHHHHVVSSSPSSSCIYIYIDIKLQGQSVESIFILPVQRIPRYRLLLEQLLKYTPNDHTEYDVVKRALEKISDMAMFSNEAIRARENKTKIMEIMLSINPLSRVDLLDDQDRRFIKEGILSRQCRYEYDDDW